ncbi:hypothetical protein DFH09DRAFT_1222456 [Mycena vulgaris]|nr:hypothetical protein DFH09DRAFT_1222456 [Mycena vulgaris]
MQSSPFENILHTNTCAELTDGISRMQKLLDDLTQKRDALDDFIAAHLAMISPARRLPEDIVRDVFVACLPAHRNPLIISNESPLLLCQICSHWRQLALSTPRLWAAVHVVVPNEPKEQVLAGILDDWLNRSGALPLSISVVFSQTWVDNGHAIARLLLAQLASFSRRWEHLRLNFPHHQLFSAFETLCPDDVPMLKSIGIRGIGQPSWAGLDDHPVDSFKFMSFLNNDSLRSLSIAYEPNLLKMPLPWDRLSSLSVHAFTTCGAAVEILRGCPTLETCVLSIGRGFVTSPPAWHLGSISLPLLRDFTVTGSMHDQANLIAFFSILVLPNLRSLGYSHQCVTFNDPLPIAPLLATTPALEQFRLTLSVLPDTGSEVLVECLMAMPLLQRLELEIGPPSMWEQNNQLHEALITRLTPRLDGPDVLCPLLQSLDLSGLNDTVSDETLLQLVRGRTSARPQGVVSLSRLNCSIARDVQVDILPLLQEEISAGLIVSIEHRPSFTPRYSPAEASEIF